MYLTLIGVAAFVLLLIVAFPSAFIRQALLAFAVRGLQAGLMAVVGACGAFFVKPELTPDWLAPMQPTYRAIRDFCPETTAQLPGFPWLMMALALVVATLPLIALLEFAARSVSHTRMIGRLVAELRRMAGHLEIKLDGSAPAERRHETVQEINAVIAALQTVTDQKPMRTDNTPRRVRDLVNQ